MRKVNGTGGYFAGRGGHIGTFNKMEFSVPQLHKDSGPGGRDLR